MISNIDNTVDRIELAAEECLDDEDQSPVSDMVRVM